MPLFMASKRKNGKTYIFPAARLFRAKSLMPIFYPNKKNNEW
jgi:hypothetical protein